MKLPESAFKLRELQLLFLWGFVAEAEEEVPN